VPSTPSEHLAHLAPAFAGSYTLERELGRGGMATVYLADDLKHHRKVAIKVLRPELGTLLGPGSARVNLITGAATGEFTLEGTLTY
jgi:hypothetical protein